MDMLIDFNSPAAKRDPLGPPLIPVPQVQSSKEVDEPNIIDPFEVQEMAPDPFEVVINAANNLNVGPSASVETQVPGDVKTENILINIHSDKKINKSPSMECPEIIVDLVASPSSDNVINKPALKCDQPLSRNEIPKDCKVSPSEKMIPQDCKGVFENSQGGSTGAVTSATKSDPQAESSGAKESDDQPQIFDFSSEESLKAMIAKRVNKCIQETLNGSINRNNSLLKKPQNHKRSLSFIGVSSAPVKKECERLNKSCTDVNDSFDLENQQLNNSNESSGFGVLSANSTDVSAEDGNGEDKVFKEARKLSRTFSKLAESFRQDQDADSDDEDLINCKPKWLSTDSSEDEEEKLLKDPALNFRRRSNGSAFSSPAATPPAKGLDSPALLAFKSRRSFTQLQAALNNTQEEITMKRSVSVASHLKEIPVIPPIVATGPVNLLKTDDQPLKLRKNNVADMKKGPLRAVMPVQSMTKEPVQAPVKNPSKQDTSPESRIQKTVFVIGTPTKDSSQLNIPPMASSTPNKEESFGSNSNISQLKPTLPVVNKRHSLEGSFGGHKSREATSEDGARARSSSASSSIPRVMPVKPLRGLPLAAKSTSNLQRPRMNSNSLPVKKNSQQLKTDVKKSRVLADVKTKSPIQAKVRTAVNSISSLVRGKKSAARDKENRFPA